MDLVREVLRARELALARHVDFRRRGSLATNQRRRRGTLFIDRLRSRGHLLLGRANRRQARLLLLR